MHDVSTPLSFVGNDPHSPWATYLSQVDRVLPYLGNLARWAETLKRPKRALIVDVPIEMDDGSVRHFEGYRVQHNLSRGPGKGGIRFLAPMTASILSNGRHHGAFGMAGGSAGAVGRNHVERADGRIEALDHIGQVDMQPGDVFVVATPGGGGYGKEEV
jgi:hypothetical protein